MARTIKAKPVEKHESIYDLILAHAIYARNSHSVTLLYETYGEAKMAWRLGAISKDDFYKLNNEIIVYYNTHGSEFR